MYEIDDTATVRKHASQTLFQERQFAFEDATYNDRHIGVFLAAAQLGFDLGPVWVASHGDEKSGGSELRGYCEGICNLLGRPT